MQVGETQDFLGARGESHCSQFRLVLASREEAANQLPDAGTVEVGDIPEVQEHALLAVLKKVDEKIVDRLAFDKRKPATDVNDRHVAQLPRACTESQANPLQSYL